MSAAARAAGCLAAVLVVSAVLAQAALGAGPPPLSGDRSIPDLSSRYGSGAFGRWGVDRFGLPAYAYTIDPATAPQAHQSELAGSTDAWHQLGNDYLVADAHNSGYVQLWSQARAYQWINRYEPAAGHYAGGYGYLRLGDRTISTLYADRPPGARTTREFGSGYFHRRTAVKPVAIDENVYAPFGNAPLLLHDVTIRNTSHRRVRANWVEYWDVNPYDQYRKTSLGLGSPRFEKRGRTVSVAEAPDSVDSSPLSVFAATLRGRVRGWETNGTAFFGGGGRADPAEVSAGALGQSIAPPVSEGNVGSTMLALRSPVSLRPGQSVTLRYAYGAAHAAQIPRLVSRWRRVDAPFASSQRAWASWVPKATFSGRNSWLSRELAWDGYMLRSGATFQEACGHHIVSQGGYYQYEFGWQAAFRDPLQHVLPLIYSDPGLAREVLRYSAQEQDRASGEIPYSMGEMCRPLPQGTSNDLDLWLLWTAAEYGLASRDTPFFNEKLSWRDGGSSTLWKHLVGAFTHQESLRGPHGGYLTAGTNGDWSDLSTTILGMTESTLVTAQLAYIYPRLAALADLRGAKGFARRLRAAAAQDRAALSGQWTGRGWYSRGYAGNDQLGDGAIFGEPQPWALLAGVPTRSQARTLVSNIRRFLTGSRGAAAAPRARADRLLPVTGEGRPRGDRAFVLGAEPQQRGVPGRGVVLGQRLADPGPGPHGRDRSSRASRRVRRVPPQHPRRSRARLSRPLERDPLGRRRLLRLLRSRPLALRDRLHVGLRHPDHASAGLEPVRRDPACRHRADPPGLPDRSRVADAELLAAAPAGRRRLFPRRRARLSATRGPQPAEDGRLHAGRLAAGGCPGLRGWPAERRPR